MSDIERLTHRITLLELDLDFLKKAVIAEMSELREDSNSMATMLYGLGRTSDVEQFLKDAAALVRKNASVPVKAKPNFTDDVPDDYAEKNRKSVSGGAFRGDGRKDAKVNESYLSEAELQRRHFEAAAKHVRSIEDPVERHTTAKHFARVFRTTNPRLDEHRFHKACGTDGSKDKVQESTSPLLETS